MRDLWKLAGLLGVVTLLSACSGDSFVASATSPPTNQNCVADPTLPECLVTATAISLSVSKREVKSDNSDISTITATVLDENNAALKNAQVTFSTLRGKLSASILETDEKGEAKVEFSSGSSLPSNGTVYVTAVVPGVGSATTPIDIVGSTMFIEVGKVSVSGSTTTQQIKVVAKDAGDQVKENVPITFALSAPDDTSLGTAAATLSSASATTNAKGEVTVTLTATSSGKIKFITTGLGTSDNEEFTVSTFRITSPTSTVIDPDTITADGTDPVTVRVSAQGVASVQFNTSIGVWVGSTTGPGATEGSYIVVPVNGITNEAQAILRADAGDYGLATVEVIDTLNSDRKDSIPVAMSPPVSAASTVSVQSDVKTLQLSSESTQYSTVVRATVLTNAATNNYPVNDVPVVFSITRSVGGGEYVSQAFGYTGLDGVATTKLFSGNKPTGQEGAQITATVAQTVISGNVSVEIGGVAGSVALGTPRLVDQVDTNKSINIYNMSALVADGTGAAVSGAQVTLHFWPSSYLTGVWYDDDPDPDSEEWRVYYSGSFNNEDRNENLILDPGEDVNSDNELTPANSTAGAGPSIVTTGSNGAAPFDFTYLKDFAIWVQVRARGSVRVLGTEMTTTTYFVPAVLKSEVDQGLVNNSPFQLIVHGMPGATAQLVGTAFPWNINFLVDTSDTISATIGGAISTATPTYTIPTTAISGTSYSDIVTISSVSGGGRRSVTFSIVVIVD